MKSFRTCTFVATGLIVILVGWPTWVAGGIKCWTNSEGMRECGNVVPPEYAQKSHRELNPQGVLIEQTARAKTQEELQQEQAEKRKRAAEKAELARIAHEQAKRDRVLLHTFTTEEDMALARDGKLQTIEARVRHVEGRIGKLDQSLENRRARAALLERRGNIAPAELQKEILDIEREISDNRELIQLWRAEQGSVRASFEVDLQRFRQLKGNRQP
ncbi:MAG: hypothetical protein WAN46_01750 [Gammaproteobacteria bacterium]|jgi:hypothetical protein